MDTITFKAQAPTAWLHIELINDAEIITEVVFGDRPQVADSDTDENWYKSARLPSGSANQMISIDTENGIMKVVS